MRNQAQARRDSGMKWEWRETGNFYFAPFGQKSEGGGLAVHRLFAHNKIQAHPLIVKSLDPGDNLLDRFAVFFRLSNDAVFRLHLAQFEGFVVERGNGPALEATDEFLFELRYRFEHGFLAIQGIEHVYDALPG
jgi:hypothetical protein